MGPEAGAGKLPPAGITPLGWSLATAADHPAGGLFSRSWNGSRGGSVRLAPHGQRSHDHHEDFCFCCGAESAFFTQPICPCATAPAESQAPTSNAANQAGAMRTAWVFFCKEPKERLRDRKPLRRAGRPGHKARKRPRFGGRTFDKAADYRDARLRAATSLRRP